MPFNPAPMVGKAIIHISFPAFIFIWDQRNRTACSTVNAVQRHFLISLPHQCTNFSYNWKRHQYHFLLHSCILWCCTSKGNPAGNMFFAGLAAPTGISIAVWKSAISLTGNHKICTLECNFQVLSPQLQYQFWLKIGIEKSRKQKTQSPAAPVPGYCICTWKNFFFCKRSMVVKPSVHILNHEKVLLCGPNTALQPSRSARN